MHAVGQFIGKVQLGGKFVAFPGHGCRADFEVNVYRSYGVPARIDGQEPCCSMRIGHLISTQKLLSNRAEARISDIGVDPHCIAMPDIEYKFAVFPRIFVCNLNLLLPAMGIL